MTDAELRQIRDCVAEIGARIQPLLSPCEGLSKRNAFAHIWLGVKTRFGESWRTSARAAEVGNFLNWLRDNPNADYDEYTGSIMLSGEEAPPIEREPTLFDS